jgi:hypothetical protein
MCTYTIQRIALYYEVNGDQGRHRDSTQQYSIVKHLNHTLATEAAFCELLVLFQWSYFMHEVALNLCSYMCNYSVGTHCNSLQCKYMGFMLLNAKWNQIITFSHLTLYV